MEVRNCSRIVEASTLERAYPYVRYRADTGSVTHRAESENRMHADFSNIINAIR